MNDVSSVNDVRDAGEWVNDRLSEWVSELVGYVSDMRVSERCEWVVSAVITEWVSKQYDEWEDELRSDVTERVDMWCGWVSNCERVSNMM